MADNTMKYGFHTKRKEGSNNMEEIEKLLNDMMEDIKQSRTDLECAFGDDTYECAVNSRINVLMQYARRVRNIRDLYNSGSCENDSNIKLK